MEFIKRLSMVIVLCGILAACSGVDSEEIPNQRTAFEKYLDGLEAEYTIHEGVYRYVSNADTIPSSRLAAETGNTVEFWFEAWAFRSNFDTYYPFYSNIPDVIDYLEGIREEGGNVHGITPGEWSREIMRVTLGNGEIIKSLESGLYDSRRGEIREIYITSDLYFGEKTVGTLDPNTPVVFRAQISNVI